MPPPTLSEVTTAYTACACVRVNMHPLARNPLLTEYRNALRRIEMHIEAYDERLWVEFRRQARRLSFCFHHAPLPINHWLYNELLPDELFESMIHLTPRQAHEAVECLRLAQFIRSEIRDTYASPYSDLLKSIVLGVGAEMCAVAVVEPGWVTPTVEHFRSQSKLARLPVVASMSGQLAELRPFDQIYVIGTVRSHPEYIYTASRAETIHWLLFEWMRTDIMPALSLNPDAGGKLNVAVKRTSMELELTAAEQVAHEAESQEDAEPDVAWTERKQHWQTALPIECLQSSERIADLIPARLLHVRGGKAVLVPVEEEVECIEAPTPRGQQRVEIVSKLGAAVDAGDFIVVYARGSREFLISEANRLLGSECAVLREAQAQWKQALRERVDLVGFERAATRLKELGAVNAEPHNVRNWISPYFIRPKKQEDLVAVRRFCDALHDVETIWNCLTNIVTAHQVAGKRVKRRLEQEVNRFDARSLVAQGRADISLGEDAGTLILVEVERAEKDTYRVAEGQVLRLLE